MASKSQLKRLASQKEKEFKTYHELLFFHVGSSALIYKKEGSRDYTRTSRVIKYLGRGDFETLNSIYTPINPRKYDRTRETVDVRNRPSKL